MATGLKLITAPAVEPVSLADIKLQCRVDTSDDDTLLTACIKAARAKAENYTGTALITQTWEQTLDAFPCYEIELLKPPVTSIVSVKYVDVNGVLQAIGNTLYVLNDGTFPGWLLPAYGSTWPSTQAVANAVAIRYATGYADAASVPSDIVAWLKLTAAFLYAQRESMVIGGKIAEIPSRFIDALLDPYRVFKA